MSRGISAACGTCVLVLEVVVQTPETLRAWRIRVAWCKTASPHFARRIGEIHRAVADIREEIHLAAGEAERVLRDEAAARRARAAVLSRPPKDPST